MDNTSLGLHISRLLTESNEEHTSPENCKFKVGDLVNYIGHNSNIPQIYKNNPFIISAITLEYDDGIFEIVSLGFPYALWDYEIELYSYTCSFCSTYNENKVNCIKCGAPYGRQ